MRKILFFIFLLNGSILNSENLPVIRLGEKLNTNFSTKDQGGILKKNVEKIYAGVNQKINDVVDIDLKTTLSVGLNYNSLVYNDNYNAVNLNNNLRLRTAWKNFISSYISVSPSYTFDSRLYSQNFSTGVVYKKNVFSVSASYSNNYKNLDDGSFSHLLETGVYFRTGKMLFNFHKISINVRFNDISLKDSLPPVLNSISCSYEYRIDLSDVFDSFGQPPDFDD